MAAATGSTNAERADWTFYVFLAAIAVATSVLHEAGHWIAGQMLGYSMKMSLNAASPIQGALRPGFDATAVAAAGPLVTMLQAIAAYWLIVRTGSADFYPPLLCALFMGVAGMLVSVCRPNDEAAVSLASGLGTWTLPLVAVAFLFVLTWRGLTIQK